MTDASAVAPALLDVHELINPNGYPELEEAAVTLVRRGCPVSSLWIHVLRDRTPDGSRPEVSQRVRYAEYDENAQMCRLPPGDYCAELRVLGQGRNFVGIRAKRIFVVDPAMGGGAAKPTAVAAAANPAASGTPTDIVFKFLTDALARSEERTTRLIEAMAKRDVAQTAPVDQLITLFEGMRRIDRMAARPAPEPATEWGGIVRDALSAISQVSSFPAAQRPVPPAALPTPNGSGSPVPDVPQAPAQLSQGYLIAAMLLTGAKSSDPDPERYAGLVADFLEGAEHDVSMLLKAAKPGDMTEQYATLYPALVDHKAFLMAVEAALHDMYADTEVVAPVEGKDTP